MIHEASWIAVLIFAVFVALTLAISFPLLEKPILLKATSQRMAKFIGLLMV